MYRRLSWSQDAVRLRVILGKSWMNTDNQTSAQALTWMFIIRFLFWHIPVGRVMQLMTESRSQFNLTFYLPRMAKLVVNVMGVGWHFTRWSIFNPEMTILRDPDFCASNRPSFPLSLKLFGSGDDTEYMEPFTQEIAPEEVGPEEFDEQPAPPTHVVTPASQPRWTPVLVACNADVPYRELHGVDEVPLWVHGVSDTKSLYDGEDTEPGVVFQETRVSPRPRPLQSS